MKEGTDEVTGDVPQDAKPHRIERLDDVFEYLLSVLELLRLCSLG